MNSPSASSDGDVWVGAQVSGRQAPVSGFKRGDLVRALAKYVKPDTALGVRLFAIDLVIIIASWALVLWADSWWLRIPAALLVGFKFGAVYTLSHDALHGNLTTAPRLNRLFATLGYLITFHNFRIRQYDHMLLGHHPHLNGPQHDAYRPLSPAEYRAAAWGRRLWERFLRAPLVLPFAVYGVAERWWGCEFFAPKAMPAQFKREARWLQVAVVGWIGALVALSWASAAGRGSSFSTELLLIFMLPVFVFQSLQSMVLYLQHTNPEIPWFAPGDPLMQRFGPESLTVHIKAPRAIGAGSHDILEHVAHHVIPAIPCYRLFEAQSELTRILGGQALQTHLFAVGRLAEVMGLCKLYDYQRHCWTDFSGRVTAYTRAAVLLAEQARAADPHAWPLAA